MLWKESMRFYVSFLTILIHQKTILSKDMVHRRC